MTNKEIIAILQALDEGKDVVFRSRSSNGIWMPVINKSPFLDFAHYNYKVIETPKERPYESVEEFAQDMKENGPFVKAPNGVFYLPVSIEHFGINFYYTDDDGDVTPITVSFEDLIEQSYIWQNGKKCGVLEK